MHLVSHQRKGRKIHPLLQDVINAINLEHLRVDCPMFKKRIEKYEKKVFNENKVKKAYITWDDNDMDSSKDSENEVVNLSLMAKNYESDEEVTSSDNNLSISFD